MQTSDTHAAEVADDSLQTGVSPLHVVALPNALFEQVSNFPFELHRVSPSVQTTEMHCFLESLHI